ncbi:unnamed protein product [Hermetia illucens]|uniref:HMG box domain-containing protein n=1 Tax=Hermetia illucens TaxID=343691 RepID=A0A7R8YNG1_HERIL|nr:high mobility group protein 20A [Hermetia illucens]CAD7079246.1 unnamed protein product [Hermetia illucens]
MDKSDDEKKTKQNEKSDEKSEKSSKEAAPSAVKKKKRKNQPQDEKKINKKKVKREEGAPKLPLTGYVRYMNKRRDELKLEFPDKTAIDHTRIIAEEWNGMSDELKKPFLQAAEVDKERYNKEINEFNRSKSERQKVEDSRECTPQSTGSRNSNASHDKSSVQMNGNKDTNLISSTPMSVIPKQFRRNGDQGIPIFTDEFLEHNKSVDLELRVLRKSNVDYEQQNSVLEKHIENMRFGVEKMNSENAELQEKNKILELYLKKLKHKLIQSLGSLSLPNEPQGATADNFEKYMAELYSMATSNSHGPACLNKAKDIVRKLDVQVQL